MTGITVRLSMVAEAFLAVGSERAAIDTAMKILRNADGSLLDRRAARAVVRAARAAHNGAQEGLR